MTTSYRLGRSVFALATALLPIAGGSALAATKPLGRIACDDSIKQVFAADPQTTVVLVKSYRKGEGLFLSQADLKVTREGPLADTPKAAGDICLVKLNVGPGNAGPDGAPSTSRGIGIEIWLPAPENWNRRVHALGNGGWAGGSSGSPDAIAGLASAAVAGVEGAVSSITDGGHSGFEPGKPSSGGDFAMLPDGTVNKVLWWDFSDRSLYEQATKTKVLATAYYGAAPKFSYLQRGSGGGRQALKLAQRHPELFDGILATAPAINWTQFFTASLYPAVVFQRDLGGRAPTEAQQDLVSNAAIASCDLVGGKHLGYIMDTAACRYDPTRDREVLCRSDGGRNGGPDCVTKAQAAAINKIWYGLTADGSAPDPMADNGWNASAPAGARRWFGMPRGTSLYNGFLTKRFKLNAGQANPAGPNSLYSDLVALSLQNPTIAAPSFRNATGSGADMWQALSYAQLANAFDRGLALQDAFGGINTDDPDLAAFARRGGKLMTWHGVNDEMIQVQGTINYYERVAQNAGGLAKAGDFYRMYLVPGVGHVQNNGTSNEAANPPIPRPGQFYELLVNWVEKGAAPDRIELVTPADKPRRSQPVCPYPQKAAYVAGGPDEASSYRCR